MGLFSKKSKFDKEEPVSSVNDDDDDELKILREDYIDKVEKIIRNIESFNDSKIIHGVINNSIAFSRSGYCAVFCHDIQKLIEKKDIKSVELKFPNKNDFPQLYYCIININDFDVPQVKMLLSVNDKKESEKIFEEINSMVKYFRENN